MEWFKLHCSLLDSPKVGCLSDHGFRCWIGVLAVSARSNQSGRLPGVKSLAFQLRRTEAATCAALAEMTEVGLLDVDEHGHLIHDWRDWQETAGAARVRKYRERKALHVTQDALQRALPVTQDKKRQEEIRLDKRSVTRNNGNAEGGIVPPAKRINPVESRCTEALQGALHISDEEPFELCKGWFTGPVEDNSWQAFASCVNTPERLEAILTNGPLWMERPPYAGGYHSFSRFLRDKAWLRPPPRRAEKVSHTTLAAKEFLDDGS